MFVKRTLAFGFMILGSTAMVAAQDASSRPGFVVAPSAAPSGDAPAAAGGQPLHTAPFSLEVQKPVAPATSQTEPARGSAEVDIGALRYFAAQNDMPRVAAEIRLLRGKYPGWEPPADLFGAAQNAAVEVPLWALFGKHDLVGLKAAIADLQHSKPDWQPSTDLTTKITLAEAHDALIGASEAQQWGGVIDIAMSNRALLTCADVDALWRTAEALIHTGDEPQGIAAYRYILSTCSDPGERLATVQKASLLLTSPEALNALIEMGQRLPGGAAEFDQVRLDLLRRKIGAAASGKTAATPSAADLSAVSASATNGHNIGDAQLLGWYAYSHKDYAEAERWFRLALPAGGTPDPKVAEGLVLTLRDAGRLAEAVPLALLYAPLAALNRKLMLEVVGAGLNDPHLATLSPDALKAFVSAVDAESSADGAQLYGWHLYKANDFVGAEAWFRKSDAWQPGEASAIGLVVVAKRLQHERDYVERVGKYHSLYPKIAELEAILRAKGVPRLASRQGRRSLDRAVDPGERGWDQGASAIVKTFQGGDYSQAVALLEQRRQKKGGEPAGLSVVRGWAMYHSGDWEGARRVFSSLETSNRGREAAEALRVIDQNYIGQRYR